MGNEQSLRQALGGAVSIDNLISTCGNTCFGDSFIIATVYVDIGDDVLNMSDVCDFATPGDAGVILANRRSS